MADEIIENNEAAAEATEAAAESSAEATAVDTPEGEAVAATDTVAAAAPVMEAPARLIQPDVGFVREIIKGGGTDMKKCMQCANCSVVCNITPDDSPFPRKEMQWAQWGLKDKLMGNPDIWLCHQCNDCTAQCPRDAKPGSVMQSIAKMTISRFSSPGFLAKGVGNPAALLLMTAIPVAILALVIGIFGHFNPLRGAIHNGEVIPGKEIIYSNFISIHAIDATFTLAFVLAIAVFAMGVSRYWKLLAETARSEGVELKGSGLSKLGPVLGEIFTHKRFSKCDETEDRKTAHLFIFYAFIGLAATTGISVIGEYLAGQHSPYGWMNPIPVKWIGSVSLAAGLIGIGWIIMNRFKHAEKIGIGAYFDWLLITLIAIVIVTGGASWGFRVADIGVIAYPVYFVHLSSVLFLFIYAPFSKMAHMVYRTTALAFARVTGRDTGIED
ncbi:MAG: quinone-interacting membrane-bound oxidoreductase complex subunit QmoC [Thermoleophilia bacterium]